MNCKPGDLAIIAYCTEGQEWSLGKIVSVIKKSIFSPEPSWVVEPEIILPDGEVADAIYDRLLLPVSGLPMEEETQETIKEKA